MPYKEWTEQEINKLKEGAIKFRKTCGVDWVYVADYVGTRTPRQCSDKYHNRCDVMKSGKSYKTWTKDEECLLQNLVKEHGTQWKQFEPYFVDRDSNNLKAKYNNLVIKQQKKSQSQVEFSNSHTLSNENTSMHAASLPYQIPYPLYKQYDTDQSIQHYQNCANEMFEENCLDDDQEFL